MSLLDRIRRRRDEATELQLGSIESRIQAIRDRAGRQEASVSDLFGLVSPEEEHPTTPVEPIVVSRRSPLPSSDDIDLSHYLRPGSELGRYHL